MDIRRIDPLYAVSPQIAPEDVPVRSADARHRDLNDHLSYRWGRISDRADIHPSDLD